jgi:hypothetical protein
LSRRPKILKGRENPAKVPPEIERFLGFFAAPIPKIPKKSPEIASLESIVSHYRPRTAPNKGPPDGPYQKKAKACVCRS